MINVTNVFIKKIKRILKEKGFSPFDVVFCIICEELKNNKTKDIEARLNFLIVPLSNFEDNEEKLPFRNFILFKKNGCWLSCDVSAFFHLINSKITFNKKGEVEIKKVSTTGINSMGSFVKKTLEEHMKNEILSKKELAKNLGMSNYKLNSILKGNVGSLNLSEMCAISREFQGKNKVSNYSVLVEKIKN